MITSRTKLDLLYHYHMNDFDWENITSWKQFNSEYAIVFNDVD